MGPLGLANTDSQQRLCLQPSLSSPFPGAWPGLAMLSVQPNPKPAEQNCLEQSRQAGRPRQAGSGTLAVGHRQVVPLSEAPVSAVELLDLTAGLEAQKG